MKITGKITTECCWTDHDYSLEFFVVDVHIRRIDATSFYCKACEIHAGDHATVVEDGDVFDSNIRKITS